MQHKLLKIIPQIGNILLTIIGMVSVINASEPSLRLVSMQGKEIEEIEKQTTYQVEVVVHGDHFGEPVIELPDAIKIVRKGVSKSFSMIKGGMSQTTTYGYTLICSHEGTYTMGPVEINTSHGAQTTNTITFKVVTETKKNDADFAGFFTVLTKKVYEGDVVPLRLQIMIDPVNIQRIDVPHVTHDHINQLKPWNLQYRDIKKINDQQRLCQEWTTEIQCTKAGTFAFPITSLKAIISSGFFMSMFATQTPLAIKPLVLECLPLPLYENKPVMLLGNVRSVETKLNSSSIELGKALTLDVIINYDTRCLIKEMPNFLMPEGVNCYFSQERNEPHKKILSYVIHPTKEGSFTVDAQKISYFNSQKDEVSAVLTMPFSFKVKPGIAPIGAQIKMQEDSVNVIEKPFELSIFGLWFFTLLPLIILFFYKMYGIALVYFNRRSRIHRLFKLLKSDVHLSYAVMYDDLTALLRNENSYSLAELLTELHFSQDAIQSAKHWWELLVRQRFAPRDQHNNELTVIIKQWIEHHG